LIASNFELWKEIIETVDCGICIDPEDPAQIAQAIAVIFKDEERARQMGINGRNAVLKKYNWEQEEKKLFEVYNSL